MNIFKKAVVVIFLAGAAAIMGTPVFADDQQQTACKEGVWQALGFSSQGNCVSLVSGGQVLVWNFFEDFLLSPNEENLNRDQNGNLGVWHFLSSPTLDHDPANYSLLDKFLIRFSGAEQRWHAGTDANDNIPLVSVITPFGFGTLHPANNELAILSWRSPVNGMVSVAGEFRHIQTGGGDGVIWSIDHHETNTEVVTLAQGKVITPPTQYGEGFGFTLTVPVAEDDFLDFIVDPGPAGPNFDGTLLDLIIVGPMPTN